MVRQKARDGVQFAGLSLPPGFGVPQVLLTAFLSLLRPAGTRTPFLLSGTLYNDMIAQELARHALKGLVTKTALDPTKQVDYVCMGTVIQEGECCFWPK